MSLLPSEDPEKTKELVDKLLAYDPDSETMTPTKARELVQRSGMILVSSRDIEKAFVLDQIRRQDKPISYEATSSDGLKRGSSFNIDTKTLAIWSIAPKTNKPKVKNVEETAQGNMLT